MTTKFVDLGSAYKRCCNLLEEACNFLRENQYSIPDLKLDGAIRIVLFGLYNAGKSTLVNALVGERVAATGSAPTTKDYKEYQLKGYLIVDLPGLEAREEESRKAKDALKLADEVVYVVSSTTGLDYESIWNDLRFLANNNIPFRIVINDKQPHQDDKSERKFRQELLAKFLQRAEKELQGREWANRIFWVQALMAEKGRIEGKERLVEKSGIIPFEESLIDGLRGGENVARVLRHLREIEKALENFKNQLLESPEAYKLQDVENKLKEFKSARERLEAIAHEIASDVFGPLEEALFGVLQKAMFDPQRAHSIESEANELVESSYNSALESFKNRLEAEAKRLLKDIPEELLVGDKKRRTKLDLDVKVPSPSKFESTALIYPPDLIPLSRAIEEKAKSISKEFTKSASRAAGKTIAKTGGKTLSRALGPIIIIALSAFEFWNAYRADQREKQRIEQFLKEAHGKAQLCSRLAKQEFLSLAHNVISKSLKPLEQELYEQEQSLSEKKADIASRIARATKLLSSLDEVANQLIHGYYNK